MQELAERSAAAATAALQREVRTLSGSLKSERDSSILTLLLNTVLPHVTLILLRLQQRLLCRMTRHDECRPLARPSAYDLKRWTDVVRCFQRTSRWTLCGCVIAQAGMRSERDAVQKQGQLQQRERSQAATALQQQLLKSQARTGVITVATSSTA